MKTAEIRIYFDSEAVGTAFISFESANKALKEGHAMGKEMLAGTRRLLGRDDGHYAVSCGAILEVGR